MEIKYEAVFGDQALFDRNYAPEDCEIIGDCCYKKINGVIKIWNFSEKKWCNSHTNTITISAMRRIICTPTWTVEDQKAGRPPEVGSIFTYRDETLTCHFIDGDGEIWAHDIDNKIVTPLLRDCKPIETPEERAQRLRNEWVITASLLIPALVTRKLINDLEFIYDALLSGDLPVPVKE